MSWIIFVIKSKKQTPNNNKKSAQWYDFKFQKWLLENSLATIDAAVTAGMLVAKRANEHGFAIPYY